MKTMSPLSPLRNPLHRRQKTPCGHALSVSEAHTLMELEKRGTLTQFELGETLRLEKSSVSRLVQQLEKKGWIARNENERDQRVKMLRLTDKGLKMARQLHRSRSDKFQRILSRIPKERRGQVIESMEWLVNALRQEEKENR